MMARSQSVAPPDAVKPLPTPSRGWALFLDVDGTLLDLAASPDAVVVPRELLRVLQGLGAVLDGAVALVSGRPLVDLDRLFAPLRLAAAGQHGAELRASPDAAIVERADRHEAASIAAELRRQAEAFPGVLIEDKGAAIAVHYRNVPDQVDELRRLMRATSQHHEAFELVHGKMVFELKPRSVDKGQAIEWFMSRPPFRGRVPVFAGDDAVDHAGFAAVQRLTGHAIVVGADAAAPGLSMIATPAAFRSWLAKALATLAEV